MHNGESVVDVEHGIAGLSRPLQDCHTLGRGAKMPMQSFIGIIGVESLDRIKQHGVQILEIRRSNRRGVGFWVNC